MKCSSNFESNGQVYTNSYIQVAVSNQYKNLGTITFQWSAIGPTLPSSHSQNDEISKLLLVHGKKSENYYICTPFDYGKLITVKVMLTKSHQKQILEQIHYGVVTAEQKIIEAFEEKEGKNQKIYGLLNKNQYKAGNISFIRVGADTSKIELKFDEMDTFGIRVNMGGSMKMKNMFKIYEKQPNCLGVSIFYQQTEFMDFLKGFKICCHSGHYIKVYFQDRILRDVFLFEILQKLGVQIKQLSLTIRSKGKPKAHTTTIEQQASALFNSTKGNNKSSQIFKQDIIEDIYNILYTPLSNMKYDFTDERFIEVPQKRKIMLKSQQIPTCSQTEPPLQPIPNKTKDTLKSTNKSRHKTEINSSLNSNAQSLRVMKSEKKFEYLTFKKMADDLIYEDEKQDEKSVLGVNTIAPRPKCEKKTSQEVILQRKVSNLLKINEDLTCENQKLRLENMKLKRQMYIGSGHGANNKDKNSSEEIQKMMQIKSMIEKMAQRLEILESQKQKPNGNAQSSQVEQLGAVNVNIHDKPKALNSRLKWQPGVPQKNKSIFSPNCKPNKYHGESPKKFLQTESAFNYKLKNVDFDADPRITIKKTQNSFRNPNLQQQSDEICIKDTVRIKKTLSKPIEEQYLKPCPSDHAVTTTKKLQGSQSNPHLNLCHSIRTNNSTNSISTNVDGVFHKNNPYNPTFIIYPK